MNSNPPSSPASAGITTGCRYGVAGGGLQRADLRALDTSGTRGIPWVRRRQWILLLGDLLTLVASILASFCIRLPYSEQTLGGIAGILGHRVGGTGAFILSNLLFLYVFDNYGSRRSWRKCSSYWTVFPATACASLVTAAAFYITRDWGFGRGLFALQFAFATLGVCLVRLCAHLMSGTLARRPVLLLGSGPSTVAIEREIREQGEPEPLKAPLEGRLDPSALSGVDALVIANEALGSAPSELIRDLIHCRGRGLPIFDAATYYRKWTGKILIHRDDGRWILPAYAFDPQSPLILGNALRLMDLFVAALGLALTAPFWPLIGLLIRLDSPGPIFFRQHRVGFRGRLFTLAKFRTMRENSEPHGALWAKAGSDERVTLIGRFLRRTRLDELPQLWSILKGEMSLVGPRPERPEFVEYLERNLPFYDLRLLVRPGLTGWAQVNHGYTASVEDAAVKLQYDLYYIQENSLRLNLRILLKTVQTVLLRPGS